MIRALLEGRKTQTRRSLKAQPLWVGCPNVPFKTPDADPKGIIKCPYGKPGDLLWVRETHATRDKDDLGIAYSEVVFSADYTDPYGLCFITPDGPRYREQILWRPSIHMPRWASRLTLRITDVRVQRLQDISEADAEAEGSQDWADEQDTPVRDIPAGETRLIYRQLWESINDPGSWDANPWVWALTFDVIKANVDAVLRGGA